MLYRNRKDAGEKLGTYLSFAYRDDNPLLLGIPRGGAEVAIHAAELLNSDFSLLISCKLSAPGNEEYGFGAVAEENELYLSTSYVTKIPQFVDIDDIVKNKTREVERRVKLYRKNKPLPGMAGRTVILVDDGIATGVTLVPAVSLCRKLSAKKVIIAAPVSGVDFDEHLLEADEIMIPARVGDFRSVGQFYEDFGQLDDERLLQLLEEAPAPH